MPQSNRGSRIETPEGVVVKVIVENPSHPGRGQGGVPPGHRKKGGGLPPGQAKKQRGNSERDYEETTIIYLEGDVRR